MGKFNVGDLVQSKAGGPKLVVEAAIEPFAREEVAYNCTWWIGNKREKGNFTESALIAWVEPTK